MCDVPSIDTSSPLDVSKDQIEDFSESNEEFSSTDDDSFSFDNIDYVEASPLDSELVSSEVMEIFIPEVGGIEASNDNPIPFYDPIISGTPRNLTPSGESDFFLEVDAFLAIEDEFTSSQFPTSYLDPEGDMLLFEVFLDDDHSSDFKTKSVSTSLNSLLEETNNFNNSLPDFTTFSNVLCDAEYESDSSDDQSCFDEDVLETIVLKPLCEEEIIPMKSLRTHDSSLSILSKIDSLLDEFAGELTLLKLISPGIDETACDFEEDIRLIEKLLYDNSSPRPPKEFVSSNSDAASESFSPSPILVKDSDSLMEEIDLFCTLDYPMPPGIKDKDYDSKRDILIPKDLPSNNSLSFAEKESLHYDIPPFSLPPAKLPDGDTRILNIKMIGGNNARGQAKVVKCYNYQGEGHMDRKCTQPKRPRNTAWYKEKAMLAEAQESSQILDEEPLAFLADPGNPNGMFKIDLDPLVPRLLQNREAHIYNLKHTQEQADIHQGIVKEAKVKQPLDNALEFASYALGKTKKSSHQPKADDTNQEKLYLLHMNPYDPMRVENINEKNLRLGLQLMTPTTSSSVLVPNPIPQQPCNPPERDDWDHLFQPMFDVYFNAPTIVVSPVLVAIAPRAIGLEESPKTPHFHNDPLYESLHEDTTSQGSSSNV
nr:hypothetical protein [Tanacetum cinerariifolium]